MNDWIKNDGVKPDVGDNKYEVRLRDGVVLPSEDDADYLYFKWGFDNHPRDIVEWRFVDTPKRRPYPRTVKSDNSFAKGLSQGQVQQLLHILRCQLDIVSFHKEVHKEDAADLWSHCDKSDKFTANEFYAFSQIHGAYKRHKQEEKKFVSLITALKGLR